MFNQHKKLFIVLLLTFSGLLGFIFSMYRHVNQPSALETPIIQTFHYPAKFVKQLEGDKHAGEKIFKEFCRTCHDKKPLIDINAPRIGDKKIWQQLQRLGMPTLLNMTMRGMGAMPARGGCFECNDAQLKEAIQYILDQSK